MRYLILLFSTSYLHNLAEVFLALRVAERLDVLFLMTKTMNVLEASRLFFYDHKGMQCHRFRGVDRWEFG